MSSTTGTTLTRYNLINIAAYIINVAITFGIGVGGLFNRPTNAELSSKYQTLVTPVGFAFSIWSIIFLFQLIWVVAQVAVKSQRNNEWVQRVGFSYLLVVLAQAGWTFTFSFEYIIASFVFMVLLLFFLWKIIGSLRLAEESTVSQYILWKFPFTIHFGWILAATAVNLNVVLVAENSSASTQFLVASASLVALIFVAFMYLFLDFTIPLVLVWAWYGIYIQLKNPNNLIINTFTQQQISQVQLAAVIASLVVFGAVVVRAVFAMWKKSNTRSRTPEEAQYLRAQD